MISSSFSKTACTIGINMAVVAVLLIHMDRKAVTLMNPNINLKHGQRALCGHSCKDKVTLINAVIAFYFITLHQSPSILDRTICRDTVC